MTEYVSIAGANSLLGQHFLSRLAHDSKVQVLSLHDRIADQGCSTISDSKQWNVEPSVAKQFSDVPLLAAEVAAKAPIMLSFLPDDRAEEIEAQHLARGTRIITHCEYARLVAPLVLPGTKPLDSTPGLLATPNCTTAMCVPILQALHDLHGVCQTTITTLQAISGTDLPGMVAHAIHDQVIGHLEGEARSLTEELRLIFKDEFAVDAFSTRVPVWRGHTITMSITLKDNADAETVLATLSAAENIVVSGLPTARDRFSPTGPFATVTSIRDGTRGILLVLKGDNLEMATTGLMQWALHNFASNEQPHLSGPI